MYDVQKIEKTIMDKKDENYENKMMKKRLNKELLLIESVNIPTSKLTNSFQKPDQFGQQFDAFLKYKKNEIEKLLNSNVD